MTATATTFPALVTANSANVRKALRGGILYAPLSTALPSSLTIDDPDNAGTPVLQTLTGFMSLGFMTDDGATVSKDISSSDVRAWGEGDPVRTDITQKTTTVKFTGLESNAAMLSFFYGIDIDSLEPDATTGELHIDETGDLSTTYYRVLLLGQDGAAGSEHWPAKLLPRASITDIGDQVFMAGDTPIQYDCTVTAYKDAAAGYSVRHVWCGPGWKSGLTAAGFGS